MQNFFRIFYLIIENTIPFKIIKFIPKFLTKYIIYFYLSLIIFLINIFWSYYLYNINDIVTCPEVIEDILEYTDSGLKNENNSINTNNFNIWSKFINLFMNKTSYCSSYFIRDVNLTYTKDYKYNDSNLGNYEIIILLEIMKSNLVHQKHVINNMENLFKNLH
jgi:hypothetical protein